MRLQLNCVIGLHSVSSLFPWGGKLVQGHLCGYIRVGCMASPGLKWRSPSSHADLGTVCLYLKKSVATNCSLFPPQPFDECKGIFFFSSSQRARPNRKWQRRPLGPLLSPTHRAPVPAGIFWTGVPTCQAPLLNQLSLPVSKPEFRE